MADSVGTIGLELEADTSALQRQVQQAAQQAGQEFEENAQHVSEEIQAILNDTASSMRSRAARIAAIYRQQDQSQSDALRNAWTSIERNATVANESISNETSETGREITNNASQVSRKLKQIISRGASNVKSFASTAVRNIKSIASRIKTTFTGIGMTIATVFSTVAIAAFTKSCVESAASVKALNSQFEQTFGNLENNAEKAIQAVAKESGIVESRLQGVGTNIYAFAKTTGMDSVTALNLMQEALQVTADSAAYYDRSLEETAESLKSFLKGNYENDAALGLSCTETTRNTAANKLYGKSFIELSESQKQLTLLQMVKDSNQLSGAMGQASREADGWDNVTGNLKESWKQLLAVVGQPVLQVATQVVKKLTSALQALTVYAEQASNTISKFFGWDTDEETANAISLASDSASCLADSTDSSAKNIEETEKAAKKLQNRLSGFDELNVLSYTSSEDDESSSNGTTIATTVDTSNTLATTENSLEDTINKIKNLFKKLNFNIIGKSLAEKINSAFDNINWSDIKSTANTWAFNIASFLNGAISETDWVLVGNTLGEAFNTLLISAFTFVKTFDWIGMGIALADGVNGLIESVDWGIFAQILSGAIVGLLDIVIAFIKETDWGKIGEVIGEFVINIDWWGVLKRVGELIWICLVGIWDLLVGLMKGLGVTDYWTDVALKALEGVKNALSGVKQFFINIWDSIKGAFGNVTNWFRDTFSKAWQAVKNVFSSGGKIFEGIKDSLSSVFKRVVNSLIDGINNVISMPFNEINSALETIKNLEIAGWKPFEWITSVAVPQIPKLAKGGIVKAPTLALVGDNAGASTGNPEVMAPLNKLKGMLNEGVGSVEDAAILSQILQYLIKIYKAITSDDNTNILEIIAKLDEGVLFKRMVQLNKQYKKRHGGRSAFD